MTTQKARAPKTATAAQFRAQQAGEPLTLPSGLTVMVRPVHPFDLARRSGELRNPLLSLVVSGGDVDTDERPPMERVRDMAELIDITCCCALASPRMELDGTGEVLAPTDMTAADREAIFAWANGQAEEMARFRRDASDDVAPVGDSEDVDDAAK